VHLFELVQERFVRGDRELRHEPILGHRRPICSWAATA
jgi:hypothetical protein